MRDHFDAAHSLRGYAGECSALHGHTWDVDVTVRGERLDDVGIVYDFKTLKDDLKRVLADYDHVLLDGVPPFDTINATAENLARVVWERLTAAVGGEVDVVEVAVWESPVARVSYRP
ncbi:MAG TPA: 6-carboxytetrahydropterin synthase QueD [Coriobacteriia bacterium]